LDYYGALHLLSELINALLATNITVRYTFVGIDKCSSCYKYYGALHLLAELIYVPSGYNYYGALHLLAEFLMWLAIFIKGCSAP
jgi:hypothetical protein